MSEVIAIAVAIGLGNRYGFGRGERYSFGGRRHDDGARKRRVDETGSMVDGVTSVCETIVNR